MIELTRSGEVFVLRLNDGENRFNPRMVQEINAAIETVKSTEGPKALVTIGTGKFFSNGLDLEYLGTPGTDMFDYLDSVNQMLAQFLRLDCVTVAACNGHAFGAGAMMVLCHDLRFMRNDRGFWCLPEADLGMPFPKPMNQLVQATLPKRTAHIAMMTAMRFNAVEALAGGIVDEAVPEADLLERALAAASEQSAKAGKNISGIRKGLLGEVAETMERSHAANP